MHDNDDSSNGDVGNNCRLHGCGGDGRVALLGQAEELLLREEREEEEECGWVCMQ